MLSKVQPENKTYYKLYAGKNSFKQAPEPLTFEAVLKILSANHM